MITIVQVGTEASAMAWESMTAHWTVFEFEDCVLSGDSVTDSDFDSEGDYFCMNLFV
jgi:hypothetical protein